jgi:tRNA threonylcarbamoyladenosine biosynthesis protein TsaB
MCLYIPRAQAGCCWSWWKDTRSGAGRFEVLFSILMILLAVDTSGKQGSMALARVPDRDHPAATSGAGVEIIEVVALAGGTFSAQLVPQISSLLAKHRLSKRDIGGLVVASGPGSFTGLRVGLAAIKALAEILGKPIAAVSLLEAVARSGTTKGKVLSALDAGRSEVYAGEYEVGNGARKLSERLLTRAEFLTEARGSVVVTPDSELASLARGSGREVDEIERPRSDVIAKFGWQKIQSGVTIAPEELEANYIRRSDAEIFRKSSP